MGANSVEWVFLKEEVVRIQADTHRGKITRRHGGSFKPLQWLPPPKGGSAAVLSLVRAD